MSGQSEETFFCSLYKRKQKYRIKMSESYIEKRRSFDINEGLYGGISGDDGR